MVIRMRHTKSHRNNRRSHHALEKPSITTDVKTGVIHIRHRASAVTGTYRGRKVVDVVGKIERKMSKKKSKVTSKEQTDKS